MMNHGFGWMGNGTWGSTGLLLVVALVLVVVVARALSRR